MAGPRGRYAPTPSGLLHVGNARTALVAWLSIRRLGGTFVWRLEDLDPPRALAGAAEAAMADLRWLGLDWDEGPDVGGRYAPYRQSARAAGYRRALAQLAAAGHLFPCRLSRKDLQQLAVAPHGERRRGLPPYPRSARPKCLAPDWLARFEAGDGEAAAIRFRVHERPVRFLDRCRGEVVERVDRTVGDFVLKRRDGLWAYQLAVVVDDLAMAIDEVVRGVDILDSTGRQIQLIEALGGRPPAYAHVPLVRNADGAKLSKRDGALTLGALRTAGVAPERLVGYLAYSLGLRARPDPCPPRALIEGFAWRRLGRRDWRLPEDLATVLRAG